MSNCIIYYFNYEIKFLLFHRQNITFIFSQIRSWIALWDSSFPFVRNFRRCSNCSNWWSMADGPRLAINRETRVSISVVLARIPHRREHQVELVNNRRIAVRYSGCEDLLASKSHVNRWYASPIIMKFNVRPFAASIFRVIRLEDSLCLAVFHCFPSFSACTSTAPHLAKLAITEIQIIVFLS